MKIFIHLCAILPLTTVLSASKEDLHTNILLNTEIKDAVDNISMFLRVSEHQAKSMADTFYKNINTLNLNYGKEKSRRFRIKYGAKADEFAKNPVLRKDCIQYIMDLLKDDEKHQREISEYITEAAEYLAIGFNSLYGKFADTIISIIITKREAQDCGLLPEKENETLSYDCMMNATRKAKLIESKAIDGIFKEALSLANRTNRTVISLYQSIKDRIIPEFYDEDGIDGWLKKFCS